MKIFVDWAVTKPHVILVDDKITKISTNEFLKLGGGHKIFMETGCPNTFLLQLKRQGNEIYQIDSQLISRKREELGIKKSDKNDVKIIRELVKENGFKEADLEISVLTELMRRYEKIVKISKMLQNQYKAYVREFGDTRGLEQIKSFVKTFECEKIRILDEVRPLITDKLDKVNHIKGLGVRYLAGILAYAHPRGFPSLCNFLSYCGRVSSTKKTGRYNHRVSSLLFQISDLLIMNKDRRYYSLYLKIKTDLSEKYLNYPRWRIHRMAKNRIETYLLKEIYELFRGGLP